MSAAQWRRAMNTQVNRPQVSVVTQSPAKSENYSRATSSVQNTAASQEGWWSWAWSKVKTRHIIVILALLIYPMVASPFFTYQIAAQSMALGLIALSLTFLGGYGGMVSLSQMTVAGVSGYLIAIFGTSSMASISLGWPWWLAVIFSIVISMIFATLVGWLSIRTEGIHTIMITLAIGVAFFYLT
jgi:branched-chain amino acid transport system permease protein